MANKHNISNINEDAEFIEIIRRKDELIGGVDLLQNFEKINNKINQLKMKGFKIILQHEENMRRKKQKKRAKILKSSTSVDALKRRFSLKRIDTKFKG